MGMFKSLGLSPAKRAGTATSKALRRLFGRGSSAGDGEGTAASQTGSPDDEQADPSYSENTHNNHVDSPGAKSRGNNQRDNTTLATNDNALSSRQSLSSLNIQPTESENKTDSHIATETMAASQSLQHPGKENRPPSTADITNVLSGLSLGNNDVAPAGKPVPVPAPVPTPILSDPAVVAERAMHMKFTEDALDMVSSIHVLPRLAPRVLHLDARWLLLTTRISRETGLFYKPD
jgi:tRNA-specific adenosine deaminase 2